ncbi:MAG: hypothetical protein IBJ10_06245 [Phycisphaerales bacterium]|nr:hypothetical protein [Phycisphaerales bacterium]
MSKQLHRALLLACGGALSAGAAAGPYLFGTAVRQGDNVAGVGLVTSIDNLAINNKGQWFVEVDTNGADTNTDGALLSGTGYGSGFSLFIREGDQLGLPAGVSVDSFDAVTINNNGDGGFNFFLGGLPTSQDSGVFFNTTMVIQEGFVSGAAGFSPNTPYIGWFETRINDSNQIMMMASVDDPAIPTTVDRAIVVIDTDGAGGLVAEKVYLKEGDQIAGQGVTDFGTGPHSMAFNNAGQMMFVADLDGATTSDGLVGIANGDNVAILAQEGTASGIQGRNWGTLPTSTAVALNDNGDWAMRATLAGDTTTDTVIVRNGEVVAQEGFGHASIGGFVFTSFGTGAIDMDNHGNVLYYGDWDDPNTLMDTGLFLNDQLIVQEGVTLIDGLVVTGISAVQDNFAISDNGRWIIFEGTLAGGISGAFIIQIPAPGGAALIGLAGLAGLRRRR